MVVVAGFGVSHYFFNRGEIGLSVPLAYPALLYLLARSLWLGFRGGDGLRPEEWAPYVGGLTVHDVDALHAHLTRSDAIREIAPALRAAIAREPVHDRSR